MTSTDLPADIDIAPDVALALSEGRPVVALESTIIAHGMPFPDNLETARALETIIRDEGATPATIAVIAGRIKVGLLDHELKHLASAKNIIKVSTHDLPYAVALKRDAATTVAATMRIAALAGIRIFATGGIGGVHRGARETFDISADITELGRTSVAVIAAGAKSILDLPATLEALETASVPVVTFGGDDFPAFYSRSSGLKTPLRLDSAEDIARMLAAKWRLKLHGGVLVANPIPVENEIAVDQIGAAIDDALKAAAEQGITGKAVTPFLLDRVNSHTERASLAANVALVKNNARLGARIARGLAEAG